MTITGTNHIVLYVRDARVHEAFYRDHLDFDTIIEDPDGHYVFMRAPGSDNHHDIAFFTIGASAGASAAGSATVGMYHVAWAVGSIEELITMRDRLAAAGALVGASDHGVNKSLYCHDPDGLEFEVTWLVPPEHWGDMERRAIIEPLDLEADRDRFDALLGPAD